MKRTLCPTCAAPAWLGFLVTALLLLSPATQAAGTVTVTQRANGDMVLTGDAADNSLFITFSEQFPIGALIGAQGDTLLAYDGATGTGLDLPLHRHLIVNLGAGNDALLIGGEMVLPGDLRVSDPAGEDLLQIVDLIVAGKTHLRFGGTSATVNILGLITSAAIVIGTTAGADAVIMEESMTLGSLRVALGAGEDLLAVESSTLAGGLGLSGGAANDRMLVFVASLGGVVSVDGGQGRDELLLAEIIPAFFPSNVLRRIALRTGGNREPLTGEEGEANSETVVLQMAFTPRAEISITGGNDADSLILQELLGARRLHLRSGPDDDLGLVASAQADELTIDTGRGADELLLNGLTIDGLLLGHLGPGDDLLGVRALQSFKIPRFDGGSGEDTVTDYPGHEVPGAGPKFLDFEIAMPPTEDED